MNNTITIKAPAKINLFLEVNNKRNDGYHDLTSIMQTISLCDTLEVSVSSDENITVEVVDYPFLSNEHNISCIAARLFMTELGQNRGVKIWIEKKIPVVAGLAGGSADAAATLWALNEIYGRPFSMQYLLRMAQKLGADVPFCLYQGTALVCGIGEVVERCTPLPKCYIVIVKNRNKTSTADMFHKIDVLQNRKKKNINVILEALETQSINKIGNEMYNAFSAIDSDENDLIQKQFLSLGAAGTCLSGSGPSNIGLFEFNSDAEKAYEYFAKLGMNSYIAEPITSFNFFKPKLITSNC